jgi:hypothetical protein
MICMPGGAWIDWTREVGKSGDSHRPGATGVEVGSGGGTVDVGAREGSAAGGVSVLCAAKPAGAGFDWTIAGRLPQALVNRITAARKI